MQASTEKAYASKNEFPEAWEIVLNCAEASASSSELKKIRSLGFGGWVGGFVSGIIVGGITHRWDYGAEKQCEIYIEFC